MSKYENLTDADLWNHFVNGNKNVLEILYKRHYDTLLNYGLKFDGCKSVVEDSIQDLFIKLYLARKITLTPYVRAYLLKSLRNILLDKIEISKAKIDISQVDFNLLIDDTTLQTIFHKSDKDIYMSRKLVDAFSRLSRNQKQIIYLRYIKNLSHKEISFILDINEQSAMNLLSRTLVKLRDLFINLKFILFFP